MKITLDQDVIEHCLPGGMRIRILPRPEHAHTFTSLSVSYGAIHDGPEVSDSQIRSASIHAPYGTAHFLEHMMFCQPGPSVNQRLRRQGASTSALTRYDVTTYQMASTDHYYSNLALFMDLILTPYFPEERIQLEKSIIRQELSGYTDETVWLCMQQLLSMLYGENHPLAMDVAGTPDSIEGIHASVLHEVYGTYYTQNRMALTVAGPVEADAVIDYLESAIPAPAVIAPASCEQVTLSRKPSIDMYRETQRFQPIPVVQFGFAADPASMSAREHVMLMVGLEALFGEASLFFQEAVHNGLINKNAAWEHYYRSSFSFSILSGFSIDPKQLYNQVVSCLMELPYKGISGKVLQMSRMKCIGRHYADLDSLKQACMYVSESALMNLEYMKMGEMFLLPSDEEILHALYQHAVPEKLRMSVMT